MPFLFSPDSAYQNFGMYNFKDNASLFNQVMLLSSEEQINLLMRVRYFFEDYHLHEVRQHLWNLFEVAVTSEKDLYAEVSNRNKLLTFCRPTKGF